MKSKNNYKNETNLLSRMNKEYLSFLCQRNKGKQNASMNMLKICVILGFMLFTCKTVVAQVKQQKLPTQTIVRTPPPYIVHGNYKDNYSIGFKCQYEAVVNGNLEAIYTGCDVGSYSAGYEDGYNGEKEKVGSMIIKTIVKGILVISAALSNTVPEEVTPLTNKATNLSIKELSYKNGYSDGQKDRRTEEVDIAEGEKQGRKIIYSGQNQKYKEKYKR